MESSISAREENSTTGPPRVARTVGDNSNKTSEESVSVQISKRDGIYHAVQQDEIEFQGYSADRSFVRSLDANLGSWYGGELSWQQLPAPAQVPTFFEVERQAAVRITLPEKELAAKLVNAAFDAQILLCLVHRPSFETSFNLVYSLEETNYSVSEKRFLPLLYAVFAYGCMAIPPGSYGLGCEHKLSQG